MSKRDTLHVLWGELEYGREGGVLNEAQEDEDTRKDLWGKPKKGFQTGNLVLS
jgi:hypothetical protein